MSENKQGNIIPLQLEKEMKDSFISYAMAVIINRALPDVRDGLKPVHRRILYSMVELGLQPDKPFRKSARIVGDTMGKYHPHGDSALYMAMVRLAQDFSTRYPLVQGHGNFGSVDGDSPAAMRYTEAKLSKLSMELLKDIDKDTIDYYPNFDESLMQPEVLPARFPNLLVNGSSGIAVGMATNIPPHNLGETIDACIALIDNPEISIEDLMTHVIGPDFPTAGIIMGTSGIRQSYLTGRGRIVVRAKTEIEPFSSNRSRIIITELPYQVNKARLVEKIAELVHEKRVDGITDLRDESDRDGMRVVIELRRDVNAAVLLNQLYKHTQLQDTFGVIMLALVNGQPKVLTLKEMLSHYIEHQVDVVTRRTQFDLDKAQARNHILGGIMIALNNIDQVIKDIRASSTDVEAKEKLINNFELSEKQAQAILDMRFRRLTSLETAKIEAEIAELEKSITYLQSLLADKLLLMGVIKEEMLEIKRRYADERRTEISPVFDDVDFEDMIEQEDMVVTLTHFGYIKRTSVSTYRAQRRGGVGVSGAGVREEDFVKSLFISNTHTEILFFTNRGRAFSLKCYQIPEVARTAKGTPIVNLLQLGEGEKVTASFPLDEEGAKYLVLCTKDGTIKKTPISEFAKIRRGGLIAQNLREDDELISVVVSTGDEHLVVATQKGKSIRFHESDIRSVGRSAMGVRAITLGTDDAVVGLEKVTDDQQILTITEKGLGKRTAASEYRLQHRGGKGVAIMMRTEKTGDLCSLHVVEGDEDLMLIRADGTMIRTRVNEIRQVGRTTQGVKLMQVVDDLYIVSTAIAQREDMDDEESIDTNEVVETNTETSPQE